MKKILSLLGVLLLLSFYVAAQKGVTVKGILQDSLTGSKLADATVSVVRTADSSLISFSITDRSGSFEIKNLAPGVYHLVSSFQGLQTRKTPFRVDEGSNGVDLGVIGLERQYKQLEGIVIKDDAPIKVKGDTLAFNADAFKTKPNATAEDLLKKLPGVQVDRDGTVRAQGEQVQKVYVDGKEFFGNDPKLATRNITADMIDQVEVYDDMSEQAKFNKIDDGSRTKAINLKLKKEKKKGVFGRAYAGYGTNDRYDAGVNANLFKGAMQASVIAKANNTNNVGFTVNDMLGMFGSGGFSGGGGGMGGMNMVRIGGGGGGGFGGLNLGAAGAGITSSRQLGFNYRDMITPNLDLSGSYFYNRAETENEQSSFRQTLGTGETRINDQFRTSLSRNDNHRVNLNTTWRIDSMNSIVYIPSFSFQNSRSNSDDTTAIYSLTGSGKVDLNQIRQMIESEGEGFNWQNNLTWRKRFRRTGRTLAVTLTNTISDTERDNTNVYRAQVRPKNLFQRTVAETRNYSAGFSYTEPIARNKTVELNYNYANNASGSDRDAFAFNTATGRYDIRDDLQTNYFENANITHRAGANFRVVQKRYNYQLGVSMQQTELISDNISKRTSLAQTFRNFFPTASFNYQFARSKSLRFNYRGSTRQPNVTQLQDVIDSSNAPYIYRGNAALKQEFSNNFMLSFSHFNMLKMRNFFAFINFSNTYNRITNSISLNPFDGTQLTVPINQNGYYMLNGNVNVGFPIRQMKGGNFNVTSRVMLSRDPGLVNGVEGITRNLNIGKDFRLNYNWKEKLDLGITASINYNDVKSTNPLQAALNTSYFTNSYSADISYIFPKGFILSTEFDYTFNTGRVEGFNQNFALWNASFAKQVFKNKRGEIKASVFDILNQNIYVNRNVGQGYVEDVRGLTLRRFGSLTFTYNINRMGGRNMPAMMERATRGIRVM